MKILHLDIIGGMSGDMTLAALLDAGLNLRALERGLSRLPLAGYKIKTARVTRGHLRALRFDVEVKGKEGARTPGSITRLIENSALSKGAKGDALAIFNNLARAETRIHKVKLDELHFHELGELDSIIDIVGFSIAKELLGIERIFVSNIRLANPAPVTLELLKGRRVEFLNADFETLTPTAAAIFKTFANDERVPPFKMRHIGYGAGRRSPEGFPNVLRAILGDSENGKSETIFVVETNLDDMNPQDYEYLMERLFEARCRDVFLTPVIMKKSRPGALVTALVDKENLDEAISIMLEESTSFGLRYYPAQRRILERKFQKINGIHLKVGLRDGVPIKLSPEYEDLKKLARKKKIPLWKLRADLLAKLKIKNPQMSSIYLMNNGPQGRTP